MLNSLALNPPEAAPIAHLARAAALVAPAASRSTAPRPHPSAATAAATQTKAEDALQLAELARTFSELLLANVQNTASLNLSAARSLLAHARIPCNAALSHRTETWRWSWRNFEVCATSADQILNLVRGHVERTTTGLWAGAERICEQIGDDEPERVSTLKRAFSELRDAQSAYWQAAQRAYGELIRFAQAEQ